MLRIEKQSNEETALEKVKKNESINEHEYANYFQTQEATLLLGETAKRCIRDPKNDKQKQYNVNEHWVLKKAHDTLH